MGRSAPRDCGVGSVRRVGDGRVRNDAGVNGGLDRGLNGRLNGRLNRRLDRGLDRGLDRLRGLGHRHNGNVDRGGQGRDRTGPDARGRLRDNGRRLRNVCVNRGRVNHGVGAG